MKSNFYRRLLSSPASFSILISVCGFLFVNQAFCQEKLTLKESLKIAVDNYGIIKAKANYADASKAGIQQSKLEYLPNFNLAASLAYGTVNGQNGPAYAFGPITYYSAGIPLSSQNWNAAFGGLYAANINWDFFAFGRSNERIKTAKAVAQRDDKDTQQEIFQHEIRVSAAYLNLLAAERLTESYRKNLSRADTLRKIIRIKALHDLVPGVDSSQANAEVSNARSTLLKAKNFEAEQNSNLIKLMGVYFKRIEVDTFFISALPKNLSGLNDSVSLSHPILQYYKSRISVSDAQARYYRTLGYPTFTLGSVIQARGSGFGNSYTAAQSNYTSDFSQGVKPDRGNYLFALGVSWNVTQRFRIHQQVKSQLLISEGLKDELALTQQQLITQRNLSDEKVKNAIADYYETPLQLKAAKDAYIQKTVLYKNGLTSLVDVTQALYVLVRAETDRDIAYNNVWQAILLKAAAEGDFSIFYDNL